MSPVTPKPSGSASPTATTSRPMGGRTAYTPWGASKVQRTLSVTNTAWDLWTEVAEQGSTNRSELFEVIARVTPHLDITSLKAAALEGDDTAILNALRDCLK